MRLFDVYAINRNSGELQRYSFDQQQLGSIGHVHLSSGTPLIGIDASAYVPGFQNIYGFWTDPATGENKILYIDCETSLATVVGDPLEGGRMTGAVAVVNSTTCQIFASQAAEVIPPFSVSGEVNLNPNNSPNNEFEMTTSGSVTFTCDDLHQNAPVGGDGVFYEGGMNYVRFKPKGNGNQNSLLVDGESYILQNSNTYILQGEMTVQVHNDHMKNGKAMGHWWLTIIAGTANFANDLAMATPNRLVKVDHQTAVVNEVIGLDRIYNSLASTDGLNFYATTGDKIYHIDVVAETETLIGTMSLDDVFGLEFCGSTLAGQEAGTDGLATLDESSGQTITSPVHLGVYDAGTIVFVPHADDPANIPESFD